MSNAEMLRDVADVVERDGLRPYGVGDPYPPGTPDMIQALRRAGWMAAHDADVVDYLVGVMAPGETAEDWAARLRAVAVQQG